MKDLSFFNKKEPEELYHAKIMSIDRNKGRVTLFTKNGLISVGTYLYDIDDLREGMTVLVGDVEETKVIIEKIAPSPKSSNGMSLVKPSAVTTYYGIDYIRLYIDGEPIIIDHFAGSSLDITNWKDHMHGLCYDALTETWYNCIQQYPTFDSYTSDLVKDSYLGFDESTNLEFFMASDLFPYDENSNIIFEISAMISPTGGFFPGESHFQMNFFENELGVGNASESILNNIPYTKMYFKFTIENYVWNFYYKYSEYGEWIQFIKTVTKTDLEDRNFSIGIVVGYYKNDPRTGRNISAVRIVIAEESPFIYGSPLGDKIYLRGLLTWGSEAIPLP